MKTPIALLIFNRPALTAQVFSAIRQAKPPILLVVADGPRAHVEQDAENCRSTRKIINQVDWTCEVLTNFSDRNLGCKERVASGLDWVFQQVESAIILEDDCLPEFTFFQFCEELLDRYQTDSRVLSIGGTQLCPKLTPKGVSYSYSRYPQIWGWATWRRAWQHYDVTMAAWPALLKKGWLQEYLGDRKAIKTWTSLFQQAYAGQIDTWDYAWTFTSFFHQGLHILPNVNLVSNIGIGIDATHTQESNRFSNLPSQPINFPLHYPEVITQNLVLDQFLQTNLYNVSKWQRLQGLLKGVTRR